MTTPLFPGPPLHSLPLSRGGDLDVTLVYKTVDPDTGQTAITDWPAGVTVVLTIDAKTGPVSGTAIITGPAARIHIDHALVDNIKTGTLWRAVQILPDNAIPDNLDDVLVNGQVVRYDGIAA